jgi:hypothetical protein
MKISPTVRILDKSKLRVGRTIAITAMTHAGWLTGRTGTCPADLVMLSPVSAGGESRFLYRTEALSGEGCLKVCQGKS